MDLENKTKFVYNKGNQTYGHGHSRGPQHCIRCATAHKEVLGIAEKYKYIIDKLEADHSGAAAGDRS